MSIDALSVTGTSVGQIEQQVGPATPQFASVGAPTNPFSILLAAASNPAEPAVQNAPPETTAGSSTSVNQQLVALENASTTTVAPVTSPTGDLTSSGAAIVAQAAQYLGVPYQWGGSTPAGFDCSGLTQYVFGQLGVQLPRTAAEQEQVGTPVASLAEAQPGDLLFFEPGQNGAPPGAAGHVAIYIGNDQMIAAPETGEDVQVQQVPGQPLAIRQITVPALTNPTSPVPGSIAGATGSVEMGGVAVPQQYAGLIEQAADSSGTPAPLLAAILNNESGFDPTAISSAGAEGIAQILPTTAAANGIDPFNPSSAIAGAANLLSQYHAAFGSWSNAVAAYNAGGGAVEAAGGVPENGSTPTYVADALSLAGMESTS